MNTSKTNLSSVKDNNKEIYIQSDEATENFPYFSLKNFSDKKYGFTDFESRDYKDLLRTISKLSKLPWSEIESSDRHGCGSEIIDRDSLRVAIPSEYDGKNILAFRYSGKAPIICVRNEEKLDVLYADPKFTIYKH